MLFHQIPGHFALKDRLRNVANSGRMPHAMLFHTAPGAGGMALARAFIQYIFCFEKGNDSCGTCANCLKIQKWQHPDVHAAYPVITKSSGSGKTVSADYAEEWIKMLSEESFISIDEWMNRLKAENKQPLMNVAQSDEINQILSLKSFEGAHKVMLIWLPEFMNDAAANKLLKLLEEPPPYTLFILVTEQKEKLLQTIISRTQGIHVPPIEAHDMAAYLMEKYGTDMDKALEISVLSDGNVIEARALIHEGAEDNLIRESFRNWMRALKKQQLSELIDWSDEVHTKGREWQKNFLRYALHVFRESLMMQQGGSRLLRTTGSEAAFIGKFYPFVLFENMHEYLKLFDESIYAIERNAYGKLVFTNLSLKLMRLL
jgi:DNA polymerase-3 subunit delta'